MILKYVGLDDDANSSAVFPGVGNVSSEAVFESLESLRVKGSAVELWLAVLVD